MNNKIVTIFGGTGFIGKYVCAELVKAGYSIRVVSRSLERAKKLRTGAFVGQVVPVAGDISNVESLPALVEGSYAVVNLVGILFEDGRQKFSSIHHQSASKLAQAAKKAGAAKFIHVSANIAEDSKAKYAQTKLAGEAAVINAFSEATILKPSVVFGPEDNFFNKFAAMAAVSPFLPLIGGGRTRFQPVYVGDIAKAVLEAIENPRPGSYQLGGPQVYSFRELLDKVQQFTERKKLYISIPFFPAKIMGYIFSGLFGAISKVAFMIAPPLTADQVELLKQDNIISTKSKGLKELGINPTPIDAVAPQYLARYK